MIHVDEKFVVVTGRPNVGKSSIIREVMGLDVVIGKRPGTTKRVSQYPLSDGLILVDMPGFGKMMGMSKHFGERVNKKIVGFLESNAQSIAVAIHVLDISTFLEISQRLEKKGFISVDVEMVQFLTKTLGEYPIVVANKIDKVNNNDLEDNLKAFTHAVHTGDPQSSPEPVYLVSAKTKEGIGALKNAIHIRLVSKGYKTPFKACRIIKK